MQQNVKKWIWHSSCDVNYRMLKIVNVASFLWQNIILNNHWSCLLYTHLANQYRPVHLHNELHLNSFVLAVFFKYWHRLIFKALPKILIWHCDISHLYLRWTKMLSLHIFVGCLLSQKKKKRKKRIMTHNSWSLSRYYSRSCSPKKNKQHCSAITT